MFSELSAWIIHYCELDISMDNEGFRTVKENTGTYTFRRGVEDLNPLEEMPFHPCDECRASEVQDLLSGDILLSRAKDKKDNLHRSKKEKDNENVCLRWLCRIMAIIFGFICSVISYLVVDFLGL